MKYVVFVLLCCLGATTLSAQDVYTSSGKPGYHKKTTKKKGYDPAKLILGGGINLGVDNGYANAGVSPIVGYRLTDHFSAGVGIGYLFSKIPIGYDVNNNLLSEYDNMVYPNIWTRYFFYRNFFADATFEYDFINQKIPTYDIYGNIYSLKKNVTNQCLWLGVGVRQPLGGRVSAYAELIYDVIQGPNTPYIKYAPDLRFGFAVGL